MVEHLFIMEHPPEPLVQLTAARVVEEEAEVGQMVVPVDPV
jgi:hypothetical protein